MSEELEISVSDIIEGLENDQLKLSTALNKAARVARLRKDMRNLYMIQMELGTTTRPLERALLRAEVAQYFDKNEFKSLHDTVVGGWIETRTTYESHPDSAPSKGGVMTHSVGELELLFETGEDMLQSEGESRRHTNPEEYAQLRITQSEIHRILELIKQKLLNHLNYVYAEIKAGKETSSVVEQNRRYLLDKLRQYGGGVFDAYTAAEENALRGDSESLSNALSSARRGFKYLADQLYPPSDEPFVGSDGKEIILDEGHYINRLIQFVKENNEHAHSTRLFIESIEGLGGRVSALNKLASKGVHAVVEKDEVIQCVSELFMVSATLVRLDEGALDTGDESGSKITELE